MGKTIVKVDKQEYDVHHTDKLVTYIPRTKGEKIDQLRNMIWATNRQRWMIIPAYQATLEKQAYKELLKALE